MRITIGRLEICIEFTFDKIKSLIKKELRDTESTSLAVRKYRELTGSNLREAIIYVNKLLPNDKKIGGYSKRDEDYGNRRDK